MRNLLLRSQNSNGVLVFSFCVLSQFCLQTRETLTLESRSKIQRQVRTNFLQTLLLLLISLSSCFHGCFCIALDESLLFSLYVSCREWEKIELMLHSRKSFLTMKRKKTSLLILSRQKALVNLQRSKLLILSLDLSVSLSALNSLISCSVFSFSFFFLFYFIL